MNELKIQKIQDKEKLDVISQCGAGTSVYSGNNCSTQASPHGTVDPCWSDCKPTKRCGACGKWAANAATMSQY